MGRPSLADGTGLWLAGSNGIHMMFMRFAIDAVFVGKPEADGSREVLAIRRALPPWRGIVWLVRGANGTLELPIGTIDRTNTAVGEPLRFSFEPVAGAAVSHGSPSAARGSRICPR